jgi:hypothetical protein
MTPSFTSKFPSANKDEFSKLKLVRGLVLRAHTSLTNPPKIKLFVLWGIEESKGKVGISFTHR